MAILIDTATTTLIQGMTGKEGQKVLGWMQQTGSRVAAGVTPGKGGQQVAGVPVYNSVPEALDRHPEINLSSVYVPPRFVASAVDEALAAGIKTVHIISEGVPTRDTVSLLEKADRLQARLIGPSSVGVASPGQYYLGSMGGGNPSQYLPPSHDGGGVAVLSKSGGMANTIATMLTAAGVPQTTVVGIGGDRIVGTSFADLLGDLATDHHTRAVVVIGEIGGAYEEVLAEEMVAQNFAKPVVAFISGLFAETLPQGASFGHAGAIVSRQEGSRDSKMKALRQAGATVVESPSQIIERLTNLDQ
ncbi:MAG: succinate--CoA ligase subunit alpha [Candidatus Pacebacteria bacterium CG10_big_fil_rev_8_21_14_0_10_56_10]|nr:MAG: succinate--CoA ligase subunit alpha [Candidatus Pacebacteria bacterium CG10_big_fil_rev_8_21_14_0_10_56_10]